MPDMNLSFPTRVIYGMDTFSKLGTVVSDVATRALIVTESAMHVEEYLQAAIHSLEERGIESIVFSDIPPAVSTVAVNEAADLVRVSKPQAVVGLGGMRVLSAARLAAHKGKSRTGTAPVCIEVPTSCRNHTLFRNEAVITDAESSLPMIVPIPPGVLHTILVDPALTYSLSPRYFAVAVLDTLLASIEGYMSDHANFLSDTYLERAIQLLGDALTLMMRNPEDSMARNKSSEAGLLSAMGLGSTSQGVGGALSSVINSTRKVPKSWVSAVMLPHILELYIKDQPVKLARIAEWLGEDVHGRHPETVAQSAAKAARRIIGTLDLPARLRDLNLSLSELGEISSLAHAQPSSKTLPFRLTTDSLYEVIKSAF